MTTQRRSGSYVPVRTPRPRRPRIDRDPRLLLEVLEERLPLATFHVTSRADAVTGGTLRHAVIQANATPGGDTIVLPAGTFWLTVAGPGEDGAATGDLDILQNLTIKGAGRSQTIIDGIALGDRVFDAHGVSLIIKNATIRGGRAQHGAAVTMADGDLTLRNCRLIDNVATGVDGGDGRGGAVFQSGGTLVVAGSKFSSNQARGSAGVSDGGFGRGGAIYLDTATATISKSTFSKNGASGGAGTGAGTGGLAAGGAIFAITSSLDVSASTFSGNVATGGAGSDGADEGGQGGGGYGGALNVQSGSTLAMRNTTLSNNTAQGGRGGNGPSQGIAAEARGGGVNCSYNVQATVEDCTLVGNQAVGGHGGNGRASSTASLDAAGGVAYGGGFCLFINTRVSLLRATLRDNAAVGGKGGHAGPGGRGGSGGAGQGGGVWSASQADFGDTLTISGSTLKNNVAIGGEAGAGDAGVGGGGQASGGAAAIGQGIATTITKTAFLSNVALGRGAAGGGGISALAAPIAIRDSLFASNQSLGGTASFASGGAIQTEGSTLDIRRTTFRANVAQGGPGIDVYEGGWGQGGAIFAGGELATIAACTFEGNTAVGGAGGASSDGGGGVGGGIQTVQGGLQISGSTFTTNVAQGGAATADTVAGAAAGGAICADPAGTMSMTTSTVKKNRALGSTGRGGGVYLEPDTGAGQITASVVTKNTASTEGNDIYGPYNHPAVTIDWVTVGNPGNADDTINTGSNPNFGAVAYTYRIAKHEVTIQQYANFLNAAAKSDPYSLYDTRMGTDLNVAGIVRRGTSGAYVYDVIDNAGASGNRPIAYVTWFDAARFANWMQNGQGDGDTETGAYTLAGATTGSAVSRNPNATFSIPTEDEWYKAAFYSPVKGGAGTPGYYTFATRSDVAPGNTIGGEPNQANWYVGVYPKGSYATGGGEQLATQNYLTDVGVFTSSGSYYGTFDQSGGLYEWNDFTGVAGPTRGLRGGSWFNAGAVGVSSSERLAYDPASEHEFIGFRLASPIPVTGPARTARR